MGWIAWLILGGVAGWIASMITRNNSSMGLFGNILIGILGAFAGNFLLNLITGSSLTSFGFNITTFIIAIGGAIVLLLIFNWIRRRR
ncbi:MAG: GlsB/YeaQ/YmgE family stress response membrane protein [Firmicutes bacterium HGW-Firmicutes-9]|jgi:uncharacterized membrane protein YeaQ/YmgE (transglycosylase-associated protein family)|nr:MAG: GlsB/YeaQ/YmgE family stress response membrane protein [Firmicutes bacterium HGW-Firmicutes-9]